MAGERRKRRGQDRGKERENIYTNISSKLCLVTIRVRMSAASFRVSQDIYSLDPGH